MYNNHILFILIIFSGVDLQFTQCMFSNCKQVLSWIFSMFSSVACLHVSRCFNDYKKNSFKFKGFFYFNVKTLSLFQFSYSLIDIFYQITQPYLSVGIFVICVIIYYYCFIRKHCTHHIFHSSRHVCNVCNYCLIFKDCTRYRSQLSY